MKKVRDVVIIIVLCIVYGYAAHRRAAPGAALPPADVRQDARVASPVTAPRPDLRLLNNDDGQLHDSVAGNAIRASQSDFHPQGNTFQPHGNAEDVPPPPPRGSGGGIGVLSGPGPASELPPAPMLSPFRPAK